MTRAPTDALQKPHIRDNMQTTILHLMATSYIAWHAIPMAAPATAILMALVVVAVSLQQEGKRGRREGEDHLHGMPHQVGELEH